LVDNAVSISDLTKSAVSLFNSKFIVVDTVNLVSPAVMNAKLNLLALQTEVFRQYNFAVVNQTRITAIFYDM